MKQRTISTRMPAAMVVALVSVFAAGAVSAQAYPVRPIRFIVPSAPGGGPDTVARLLAPIMSERLQQQIVVDNRPGGAFTIGIKAVTVAAADGYTIGYGSVGPLAISPALVRKLPYNADRDIQAIAQVGMSQCIVAVTLGLPVKSLTDLVQYAKANPDKLSYGASNGSIGHVSAELFKQATGTRNDACAVQERCAVAAGADRRTDTARVRQPA